MYTFYNTSEQFLRNGVYHVRRNGEIVTRLTEENAVYVKTRRGMLGDSKFYFYIIEYMHGDYLKIENYMGKNWTMLLDNLKNDINGISFFVNEMCLGLSKQNKPFPDKLENLLKDMIPPCFSAMKTATFQDARYQYFFKYKWIVERYGKCLCDYVKQTDVDEYARAMIDCYELPAVEMLLKEKNIKISANYMLAFEKAKENLNQTIEMVKERIKNRFFSGISYSGYGKFPMITIYLDDTPCGDVKVYISAASNEYNPEIEISLHIVNTANYSSTRINILNRCKDQIEILKQEIYGDKV